MYSFQIDIRTFYQGRPFHRRGHFDCLTAFVWYVEDVSRCRLAGIYLAVEEGKPVGMSPEAVPRQEGGVSVVISLRDNEAADAIATGQKHSGEKQNSEKTDGAIWTSHQNSRELGHGRRKPIIKSMFGQQTDTGQVFFPYPP